MNNIVKLTVITLILSALSSCETHVNTHVHGKTGSSAKRSSSSANVSLDASIGQ